MCPDYHLTHPCQSATMSVAAASLSGTVSGDPWRDGRSPRHGSYRRTVIPPRCSGAPQIGGAPCVRVFPLPILGRSSQAETYGQFPDGPPGTRSAELAWTEPGGTSSCHRGPAPPLAGSWPHTKPTVCLPLVPVACWELHQSKTGPRRCCHRHFQALMVGGRFWQSRAATQCRGCRTLTLARSRSRRSI
jgi:hypothetical protein